MSNNTHANIVDKPMIDGTLVLRHGVEVLHYTLAQKYVGRMLALANRISELPQELFHMKEYRLGGGKENFQNCGSVGCVLGHAPSMLVHQFRVRKRSLVNIPRTPIHTPDGDEVWVPIEVTRSKLNTLKLNFSRVYEEVTGHKNEGSNDPLWTYLFSGNWTQTDNTPTGAANRIRWVVEHEGVPLNWEKELYGRKILSYEPDPLYRPTREYLDSRIERGNIRCHMCDNDAEFEPVFDDPIFNTQCGVCGHNMIIREGL